MVPPAFGQAVLLEFCVTRHSPCGYAQACSIGRLSPSFRRQITVATTPRKRPIAAQIPPMNRRNVMRFSFDVTTRSMPKRHEYSTRL